ncbi:ABC transporter substrate-binding protein [Rhodoferax sp. AJA081-3]|uniref:ABC transporter substrate-binding protein n=1 Tax=Rhodoferax sp. AJA081-3 TaxID=2752316 RepID=UPI001ADF947D|nr:ABC transporter substrate-binding protein [Rhodoferax sp. AJA081-3]QTN28682.1 ABC transporter substrate-binding protein [Rhodoferax sp. AJA081-3]
MTLRLTLMRPSVWALLLVCWGAGLWLPAANAASITIGVSASPMSIPFYVAERRGFFRDEGLDVVLVECPTGSVCLSQLLESKVRLATASDLPIMFRSFDSVPFKVLATFAASQDVKLIVRANAGIRSSKDLKGRQVAVARGTAGQYVLDLALLAAGLDPREVSTVALDTKRLDIAAANTQTEAFALFQPGANQMLKLLGPEAVVLPIPRLYSFSFNLVALAGQTAALDEDHVRVLRALARAVDAVRAEPDVAKSMLRERLNMDAAEIALLWPDYRFALGLNQSLIATLESTARWAIQEQLVKATAVPNYLDFIDIGPLKRVRPSAVTVVK